MRVLVVPLTLSLVFSLNAGARSYLGDTVSRTEPVAQYAVLFESEQSGPVCAIDMATQPELAPKGVQTPNTSTDLNLALPACSESQKQTVAALSQTTDTRTAAVQGLFVPLCAFNFIGSAIAVAAANYNNHPALTNNVSGFALGYGTAAGVARGVDLAAKVGLGAVGFLCSGAGVYVGYMLVPRTRYR